MDAGIGAGDADPVGVRGQEVWGCGAAPGATPVVKLSPGFRFSCPYRPLFPEECVIIHFTMVVRSA